MFVPRLQDKNEDGTVDGECGSVFGGFRIPRSFLKLSANQKKRSSAYRELLHTYDQLTDRMKSLEKGKSKISRYSRLVFNLIYCISFF
jgi:hypothetical protein